MIFNVRSGLVVTVARIIVRGSEKTGQSYSVPFSQKYAAVFIELT